VGGSQQALLFSRKKKQKSFIRLAPEPPQPAKPMTPSSRNGRWVMGFADCGNSEQKEQSPFCFFFLQEKEVLVGLLARGWVPDFQANGVKKLHSPGSARAVTAEPDE
jgi:hypothetical protein